MSCDLTNNRSRACKDGIGGLKELWLFDYLENPFTVVDGECTAVSASLTVAYKYELEGDLNTLVESMVSDRNTGTSVNTQTLTISLKQMSAADTAEFNLLAKGYPMAVVVDRMGNYNAIGIDSGIDFTIEGVTGGAKTDMNGYTLTGVSTTNGLSPKLDSATKAAFIALVYVPA